MGQRLQVSEKTLELNVSAEILAIVRSVPGRDKAYLIGMTQAQENLSGVDVAAALNGLVIGAIQFKAPSAPSPLRSGIAPAEHKFAVPGQQLARLHQLATRLRGRVHYALPCVNRMVDLQRLAGSLMGATVSLAATAIAPGTHGVLVRPTEIELRSEPRILPRVLLEHTLVEWLDEASSPDQPTLLPVTEWLGELGAEAGRAQQRRSSQRRSVGQSTRGLGLLVVPPPS